MNRRLLFAAYVGSAPSLLGTPASAASLVELLEAAGHTDVGARVEGDTVTATLANQTWWRPGRAVGEAFLLMAEVHPKAVTYRLIMQWDRLPLATFELPGEPFRAWLEGRLDDSGLMAQLSCSLGPVDIPSRTRSSVGWLDVGIAPTYSLARGISLGVAETWRVTLADGIGVSAETQQALVGPALRPVERAQLHAMGWLDEAWLYRAALGFFGRPGWGSQMSLSRRWGQVEWRVNGGVNSDWAGTLTGVAVWPTPWLGSTGKLEVGKYLDGDWGGIASLLWNFERTQLETCLIRTTSGLDIRTVFTLDFAGPRKPGAAPFRLTGGEAFVPYQADRATRARRLSYVDPFDRILMDFSPTELIRTVKDWPKSKRDVLSATHE